MPIHDYSADKLRSARNRTCLIFCHINWALVPRIIGLEGNWVSVITGAYTCPLLWPRLCQGPGVRGCLWNIYASGRLLESYQSGYWSPVVTAEMPTVPTGTSGPVVLMLLGSQCSVVRLGVHIPRSIFNGMTMMPSPQWYCHAPKALLPW